MHRLTRASGRHPAHHEPALVARSSSCNQTGEGGVKSQECHICLEDLRQDLVVCPCGHVFHEQCIMQALEVNRQCPICRRQATERQLIRLYLEIPERTEVETDKTTAGAMYATMDGGGERVVDGQVAALNERVSVLIERLQWQKKQHDTLLAEMKRLRHQSEHLVSEKQMLVQRVSSLDMNRQELLSKVAKYQIELSRQAEATRQMNVNQSIINYLNTCDADAIEEEIQNPRELINALKKACKFRHDQYQKVVKEKTRLKNLVQSLQQQYGGVATIGASSSSSLSTTLGSSSTADRMGKAKLKSSGMDHKRGYTAVVPDHTASHPLEHKKRRVSVSPASAVTPPGSSLRIASSTSASSVTPTFAPRMDSTSFRASAYTDVSARPSSSDGRRGQSSFTRSSYNPNQYGAYNLTPSNSAPLVSADPTQSGAVCRRGYDETGKLTTFFIPKETPTKRPLQSSSSSSSYHQPAQSAPPQQRHHPQTTMSMQHFLGTRQPSAQSSSTNTSAMRPSSADRREYALTSWLRNGQ